MSNPSPTLATSRDPETARVKIEPSTEAFQAGREYRISEELAIQATPLVFRFECTKDFTLRQQSLECDAGALRLRAYRDTQGTEGGVFGNDIAIYKVNFASTTPDVPTVTNITTGGTFTPAALPLGKAVEFTRVKTSTQSNRQITVSGGVGQERSLAAGVYYLVIDQFDGNITAEGVFALTWEEAE